MYIPKWLFLFAASFLTLACVVGTFFMTIPTIKSKSEKHDISTKQIILIDSFIHSGPLILFLVLFNQVSKNVKGSHDLRKTMGLIAIITLSYFGYVKFTQVYESYDHFCLIILCTCVFLSSYQIYLSLLTAS